MAAVTHSLRCFISDYGRPLLLALLVHALIVILLLSTKLPPAAPLPSIEPITSYLYQPPPSGLPATIKKAPETGMSDSAATNERSVEAAELTRETATSNVSTASSQAELQQFASQENLAEQRLVPASEVSAVISESLAQRALNRAAKSDLAAIDRAATASYQQFLQQQQQPRLTVDKKHWPLSQDPARQIVAQLDDGRQIIRMNDGCRIGDPALDGFEALMAAKAVPCGDEISTSALLKQALDNHSKR